MNHELIWSVSQVTQYIKEMLDCDELLTGLCVRGEISNYKKYPSGHHYFTLKDRDSALRCVMFRSHASRLRFRPENGMTVLAAGQISVFPRDGQYQLYCVSLSPEGAGDLAVAFEQLKARLAAEGLFDERHKKPIPRFPHRIALITSEAGAALHDMLRVLGRRYPLAEVVLLPVRVQGEEAAGEIADALDYANRYQVADLIITGRGGGSMEDLWAFNEEVVARAIFRSKLPVISAVGHEPDVTIADYVADLRAATPSNGAELAAPDQTELRGTLSAMEARMLQSQSRRLKLARQRLELMGGARALRMPVQALEERRQSLDGLLERMTRAMEARTGAASSALERRTERLLPAWSGGQAIRKRTVGTMAARLDAMSPLAVLARGYSITLDGAGRPVRSAGALSPGEKISIRLSQGGVRATVDECLEE